MSSKDEDVNIKVKGDASGAQEAMRQAASSVRAGVSQIKGQLDALSSIGTKVTGVFLAVGAVLAGGKMFKEAVDETVNLTSRLKRSASSLG